MSKIILQIENDFQKAFKASQKEVYETLRMIKNALKNAAIDKKAELSEVEVKEILAKELKKRQESIDVYEKANRLELAEKEKREIEVIKRYLPPQLSKKEIEDLVQKTIKELNIQSPKEFGKVMGKIMAENKGQVDGKLLSEIVKKALENL